MVTDLCFARRSGLQTDSDTSEFSLLSVCPDHDIRLHEASPRGEEGVCVCVCVCVHVCVCVLDPSRTFPSRRMGALSPVRDPRFSGDLNLGGENHLQASRG